MISFSIPGKPMGKGRPRASSRNGKVFMRTPEETASYENLVKLYFSKEVDRREVDSLIVDNEKPFEKLTGYVSAIIICYYPIPESFNYKKKSQARDGILRPDKKPDSDNIAKIILDSLNNIAYDDDKQVVDLEVQKWYSDEPRVLVRLEKSAENGGAYAPFLGGKPKLKKVNMVNCEE